MRLNEMTKKLYILAYYIHQLITDVTGHVPNWSEYTARQTNDLQEMQNNCCNELFIAVSATFLYTKIYHRR